MEYKKQHFITASYLKAWRDPKTPNGAFVWTVSKTNRTIRRKSPKSLFSEEDFYTYYDANGNRVIKVEHQLHEIEDKFINIRNHKLQNNKTLLAEDRRNIAQFISAMFARTKRQKEEGQQIWQEYLASIETLSPEQSRAIKQTLDYQQVASLHKEQPMPFSLSFFINMATPFLSQMNFKIFKTTSSPGFITSDNPCFIYDPRIHLGGLPASWHELFSSPSVMILLPVSPKLAIQLEWHGIDGYIALDKYLEDEKEMVDALNNFTATNSDEIIVVNQKTFNESWFDEKIPF